MIKFIIRRFIQAIPTFVGITIIAYAIMALAPGGPVTALAFDPDISPKIRQAMSEALGVNDPIHEQYIRWLIGDAPIVIGNVTVWAGREMPIFDRNGDQIGTEIGASRGILRGDFGKSILSQNTVVEVIGNHIPATLELGGISLLLGTIIGITIGIIAAVYHGGWFDNITRVLAVIVSSVPVFFLGLILLLIFGVWLQWLPLGNRFPLVVTGDYSLGDRIRHLILPTLTLSSFSIATFSRFMRASLLDVLNQDYVRTARAKGLSDRLVWFKHAARNALIPIATLLGPAIPGIVTGAVLTETIYSWPGMGRLIVNSITQQDYPVIMAVVLIAAIATIIGYLLSDIMYAIFDPRIRLS